MPASEATVELGWLELGAVYALLLVPLLLLRAVGVALLRDVLVAVVRMTLQLALVGLYLRYIFALDDPRLSGAWIALMVAVAAWDVLGRARLSRRRLWGCSLLGVGGSAVAVTAFLVFAVIRPTPVYDARYLVPVAGMILGNILNSNVIALERFYAAVSQREREYLTLLLLGASRHEARQPYLREALRAALTPTVAGMATMGIVSLPGMMTGQILGGSPPWVAIEYQLAIMVAIFTAVTLSAAGSILLSARAAFDDYGLLRPGVLRPPAGRGRS